MKLLKSLVVLIIVAVLAVGVFLFGMRFHDGPLEIIAGGPFRAGELAPTPPDWNFLAQRDTIEFQTLRPARSRTVWLAVHEGRLFVVSGYMTTGYGAVWKQWPHYLEQDDRVILRIDGRLYEQRLQRITSGPVIQPVLNELSRKYGDGLGADPAQVIDGHTWMFEVLPRSDG